MEEPLTIRPIVSGTTFVICRNFSQESFNGACYELRVIITHYGERYNENSEYLIEVFARVRACTQCERINIFNRNSSVENTRGLLIFPLFALVACRD